MEVVGKSTGQLEGFTGGAEPGPGGVLDQGLSKHQEVSSTPVTKVKKLIVVFWDLLGAIKR